MTTQRSRMLRLLAASAVLAAITLAPLSALAQDSAGESQDTAGQTQTEFTDQQLKQFVAAQKKVQSVIQTWDHKIAAANKDEKADLQTKENKALAKVVSSHGLKPKTYNAIAQQAQNDPALTQRIQSFMTPQ